MLPRVGSWEDAKQRLEAFWTHFRVCFGRKLGSPPPAPHILAAGATSPSSFSALCGIAEYPRSTETGIVGNCFVSMIAPVGVDAFASVTLSFLIHAPSVDEKVRQRCTESHLSAPPHPSLFIPPWTLHTQCLAVSVVSPTIYRLCETSTLPFTSYRCV